MTTTAHGAQIPRFGEVAAQLAENGYEPLPVHFGQKNPSAGAQWQHYKFCESDLDRFANDGTGLLCGRIVGIDIDVREPELAGEIEALAEEEFGPAPRRIGQAPKVLRLYQAERPFTKLATHGYRLPSDGPEDKTHRVEILAQGQQFVAYNRHPATGNAYAWNGAGDPLTVPIGLLSTVSEARAREFIAAAEKILARHGRVVGKLVQADESRTHEPSEEQRASDPALLRQALEALPNDDLEFDDWMRVLYATKGALGDAGIKDFLRWSAKSRKDDPENSAHEYRAARPVKIGAGTVYYLAGAHGWKRPSIATEIEWPEPVNILGEFSAPEFTGDELPPVLSEFALAFARTSGFDPSLTLSAAASVAAAALSDSFQIVGDSASEWFQQPRIWMLDIGRPGTGKTPAMKAMLAPLWAIQKSIAAEHEQAVATAPEGEKVPPYPRLIVGDATIEALSERLRENPRGILLANDEFESWLGSHDAYRGGNVSRDRGEWLRLFDGGPHTIERIQRGSVFIENWGASILTATTPAALAKITRALPEDGLLQRFIPIIARRKADPQPVSTLETARSRYAETIRRLFAAVPRAHNGCVPLSVSAQEFFRAWVHQNQLAQEAFGAMEPALESHLSKYPSFILRLALTFHAAQIVNQEHALARDPAAFPVPLATLETAARFLKRAMLHAIALYLDRKSGNDVYELARDVARATLARGWAVVARRDLIQSVRTFRKASDDLQESAIRLLVDLGWLRYAEGGYLKSTPARFHVNPDLKAKFAAIARREQERRAVIRDLITRTVREGQSGQ